MKKIVHIIPGESDHLSLSIIDSILDTSSYNHFFIITRISKKGHYVLNANTQRIDKNSFENEYIRIFNKHLNNDYRFSYNVISLYIILHSLRSNPIILHAGNRAVRNTVLLLGSKNISWVCWGSGFKKNENGSIKGKLRNFFKQLYIKKYNSVLCLMSPDAEYIQNEYCKKNTIVMPYVGRRKVTSISEDRALAQKISTNQVLLGNSPRQIDSYLKNIYDLKRFSNSIYITCMLNYGLLKNDKYIKLKEEGNQLFGERFHLDEKFYNTNDYYNFIESKNIYICDYETQSGLGAISTNLILGNKVFLSGYNYNWIKELGYIVFHYNEILEMSTEEFLKPLSTEEKSYNYHLNKRLIEKNIINRESFFDQILNNGDVVS